MEKVVVGKNWCFRYVWIVEGDKLWVVEVMIGIMDNKFMELVIGDLRFG